jgi:hypothetical protein
MSKHTTLPTVARVISDTYELPCQGPLESAQGRS